LKADPPESTIARIHRTLSHHRPPVADFYHSQFTERPHITRTTPPRPPPPFLCGLNFFFFPPQREGSVPQACAAAIQDFARYYPGGWTVPTLILRIGVVRRALYLVENPSQYGMTQRLFTDAGLPGRTRNSAFGIAGGIQYADEDLSRSDRRGILVELPG